MIKKRMIGLVYGFAILAGVLLYQTSYAVKDLETQLAQTNRALIANAEAQQVLQAEWMYLAEPARIERLAKNHLAMQPTKPQQVAHAANLGRVLLTRGSNGAEMATAAVPVKTAAITAPVHTPNVPAANTHTVNVHVPQTPENVKLILANFGQ